MPESTQADSLSMQNLCKGDMRAMEDLIARWEAPLLNFIYRYVQIEAVARDLVQETFVRVFQARERYDPNRSFSTWMFGIAANLCKNHHRWLARHKEASIHVVPEPESSRTPADSLHEKERAGHVANAVAALPHRYRVAVLLYYYEGMNYSEIAKVLECSERGVESRLYRARKLLTHRLK